MLKSKIIYDAKEAVRAYSKDAKITNSLIMGIVNTTRAKYIRQHQRRNPGESLLGFTQTLIMETEAVDKTYDASLVTIGKNLARTKLAVPKLIHREILRNVSVRSMDRTAQEIEYMDKIRALYGNSTNFIFAFLDDDSKLYLYNQQNIEYQFIKWIAISAVLEDPEQIVVINGMETELIEYPMTQAIWALIKLEVLEHLYKILQIPVDTKDDNLTQQ